MLLSWGREVARRGLNFLPNSYNLGLDSVSELPLRWVPIFIMESMVLLHVAGEKFMEFTDPWGGSGWKQRTPHCSWMYVWELESTSETSGPLRYEALRARPTLADEVSWWVPTSVYTKECGHRTIYLCWRFSGTKRDQNPNSRYPCYNKIRIYLIIRFY